MQRLELITNALELAKITRALDQLGVTGYSVIRNVIGKGQHGKASDDIDATTLSNVYVLIICPETQVPTITAAVKPILQRHGGIAWVTDIQQLFP
jgi:nitrogen regulatory protein PII